MELDSYCYHSVSLISSVESSSGIGKNKSSEIYKYKNLAFLFLSFNVTTRFTNQDISSRL